MKKGFQSGKGLKAFFIYAHAEHIISAILRQRSRSVHFRVLHHCQQLLFL